VNATEVAAVARLLKGAKHPLLILGGGLRDGADAVRVADHVGAALFTTFAGCGLVDAAHPLLYGTPARPGSAAVFGAADVIVAVGSELEENDFWRDEIGHTGTMVRIDIDPECLSDRHGAEVPVLADAGLFMAALAEATRGMTPATGWQPATVAATRARWKAEIDAERPGILVVADALQAVLPDDTMIFSDMTQFAYAAQQVWPMSRPGHWHHPTGFGTLGYALPAAIGGAVGRPGKPTLCIAGDYGFQYTIQELATAVELALPLPIILWDNGKLGEIEESMVQAQIAPNAVIQQNPDFLLLARAYGAHAAAPQTLTALQAAVVAALAADRPTLIRVTPGIAAG
jgi:acetolactate synthase-1/2/3 large subunit/5-guanidino-2-oxopentanoate decarboxylase